MTETVLRVLAALLGGACIVFSVLALDWFPELSSLQRVLTGISLAAAGVGLLRFTVLGRKGERE
jgi:hypothetical protein